MSDVQKRFDGLLVQLNEAFLQERAAVEPGHRRLVARRRKAPRSRVFWHHRMPDDVSRECQYCGTLFLPDLTRATCFVAAPASVESAHRRAHCGPFCDHNYLTGLRYIRIKRDELFERDGWRCYLCNQPTPADLRGFAYVPNAPSIDHIIPKGLGTDEDDNLRCCCRRCNLEKGTLTLWAKLSIYIGPPDSGRIFPEVIARVLPRHPTLDEMIELWRLHIINEGRPINTSDRDDAFLNLVRSLRAEPLAASPPSRAHALQS